MDRHGVGALEWGWGEQKDYNSESIHENSTMKHYFCENLKIQRAGLITQPRKLNDLGQNPRSPGARKNLTPESCPLTQHKQQHVHAHTLTHKYYTHTTTISEKNNKSKNLYISKMWICYSVAQKRQKGKDTKWTAPFQSESKFVCDTLQQNSSSGADWREPVWMSWLNSIIPYTSVSVYLKYLEAWLGVTDKNHLGIPGHPTLLRVHILGEVISFPLKIG